MNVESELHELVEEVMGSDPRKALIAWRSLFVVHAPWVGERVVRLARREGWNWARIGRLLGRSRQAVRARYGDGRLDRLPPPFTRRRAEANRQDAAFYRYMAAMRRESELRAIEADGGDVVAW